MRQRPTFSKKSKGPRLNGDITVSEVRLVDENGDMAGVVPTAQAIERAKGVKLDLVEVSPNAEPPVCKILDYGKFKYQEQKKASEAKKKQKTVALKEVKLRPGIDTHDFETKMKQAHKFIDHGDKVKFTLRFRGREMAHKELGMAVLDRVKENMGEKIKIEFEPKFEGRQVVMVVSPATVTSA